MREQYVEAVLAVAELIPPGRVLSYGDIAALLESGGPRQVGAVMSAHGSAVSWWRVIRANGDPPVCHDSRALIHYRDEQTAVRGDTETATPVQTSRWRVDMKLARWNPSDADLDRIDVIAALLQDTDDGGSRTNEGGPAHSGGASETMSVPHDGLNS